MEQELEMLVFYPSPGMSHLGSMIELAKLLVASHDSISITILINGMPGVPESAYDHLVASVSEAAPRVTFRHLKSHPIEPSSSHDRVVEMLFELPRLSCLEVKEVLESKPKAFVIDFFCNAAFEVAASLGVATYFLYTGGACGLASLLSVPVIQRAREATQDPDLVLEIPGLPPMRISEYPQGSLRAEFRGLFESTSVNMANSRGIIVNTFRALEEGTLGAISAPNGQTPPIYCIGPLLGKSDLKPSQRGEELTWLDSQPSKSVVFLCFGSMGINVFSPIQLREMAIGLEKSGHRFLWVVRDPLPLGEENGEDLFPPGFLGRTQGRGLVVKNWAPQKAVLSHDSIGGFVTHCGWNSILEAVCAGVPMVTWPLYAEQKVNRAALLGKMRVALKLNEEEDGFVTATELERRVTELMGNDSECGREVRERVGEMKEAATSAMAEDGSSRQELAQFIGAWK